MKWEADRERFEGAAAVDPEDRGIMTRIGALNETRVEPTNPIIQKELYYPNGGGEAELLAFSG